MTTRRQFLTGVAASALAVALPTPLVLLAEYPSEELLTQLMMTQNYLNQYQRRFLYGVEGFEGKGLL